MMQLPSSTRPGPASERSFPACRKTRLHPPCLGTRRHLGKVKGHDCSRAVKPSSKEELQLLPSSREVRP